jgi:hypothetical protein
MRRRCDRGPFATRPPSPPVRAPGCPAHEPHQRMLTASGGPQAIAPSTTVPVTTVPPAREALDRWPIARRAAARRPALAPVLA